MNQINRTKAECYFHRAWLLIETPFILFGILFMYWRDIFTGEADDCTSLLEDAKQLIDEWYYHDNDRY
jgi:hypothetical protein